MLEEAHYLHLKGRLGEAAALCREILAQDPKNADALYLLGAIELQRRNPSAALELIDRAIEIKPDSASLFANRGIALRALKRLDEALASYDRALAITPDHAETLNNRGSALSELKRFDDALASYDRALAAKPEHAEILNNRGKALQHLKRFDEALASYDRALAIKPDHAQALSNRGNVLSELKRFDDALASYDRALAIKPDYAEALNNRGNALHARQRLNDALASYDRALAIEPGYAEALNNRGAVLRDLNRFDEALASCDRALAVQPDHAHALATRASILQLQGKIGQAIACFRQALAINPDDANLHTKLIFALNFDPSASAADKQIERARWDEQHARQFEEQASPHANDPDPYRRLRIGYVTSHFRRHAPIYAFGGVLLRHDPKQFDVVCYADTIAEDDVTARLRDRADQWHRTEGLSDDELADLIRRDRIDILVDLVGHMAGHRLCVFARKPAPIQVTAWGEPTGTGLKAMDYLLADSVLVPDSERALLVERVVNLPNFLGYWTPEPLPEPGPLPALEEGYISFGSFNRLDKITDATIGAWAPILHKLPQAHLVLKTRALADSGQRRRIEDAFAAQGISAGRLTLQGGSDRASHFAAYRKIDIALDTFPHSGGMTTLDAMWMGVPVVTWAGDTISSRLAAACLTALGLTDFVASTPEAYVDLAVAKATSLEALSRLRAGLRTRIAASEFGDSARYCRAVEAAYREMWRLWCSARASHAD